MHKRYASGASCAPIWKASSRMKDKLANHPASVLARLRKCGEEGKHGLSTHIAPLRHRAVAPSAQHLSVSGPVRSERCQAIDRVVTGHRVKRSARRAPPDACSLVALCSIALLLTVRRNGSDGVFLEQRTALVRSVGAINRPIDTDSLRHLAFDGSGKFPFGINSRKI